MRTLPLLAALALLPGCSDELSLIEIGDLRGLPIGGLLEPATTEAASISDPIQEPEALEMTSTPDVLAKATPMLSPADIKPAEAPAEATDESGSDDQDEEILLVGFDTLADFDYEVPTTEQVEKGTHKKGQIPEDVLSLDGKRIEVEGYMVPMEVEKGMVKSFVLSRSLAGCCFGDWPILNEWVDVVMKEGEGADYVPYAPVLVVGRLTVSEAVDEYGVLSIYRMVAETVEDPW